MYNIWSLTKNVSEGEDDNLNQAERSYLMKVHQSIIIASAILIFSSIFIYYGKKSNETLSVFNYNNTSYLNSDQPNTLYNTLR